MTAKKSSQEEETKIKKPQTAFFFFINERRNKFKEDNPDLSMCQITKSLSEVWKALTDAERKKYDDLNTADKDRYAKECEAAGAPKPKESKKEKDAKKAAEGGPKKGLTAYFIFLAESREKCKKEFPNASVCEQSKKIGEWWKNLSDDEKKTYQDKSVKDKERYERQKKEFDETGKFSAEKEEADK